MYTEILESVITNRSGWIKFHPLGRMLSWTVSWPPLFSERYGFRKPLLKIGKLRIFIQPIPKEIEGTHPYFIMQDETSPTCVIKEFSMSDIYIKGAMAFIKEKEKGEEPTINWAHPKHTQIGPRKPEWFVPPDVMCSPRVLNADGTAKVWQAYWREDEGKPNRDRDVGFGVTRKEALDDLYATTSWPDVEEVPNG